MHRPNTADLAHINLIDRALSRALMPPAPPAPSATPIVPIVIAAALALAIGWWTVSAFTAINAMTAAVPAFAVEG